MSDLGGPLHVSELLCKRSKKGGEGCSGDGQAGTVYSAFVQEKKTFLLSTVLMVETVEVKFLA